MQLFGCLGVAFPAEPRRIPSRDMVVDACTTCWRRCAAGSRKALLQVGKERRLHNRAIETYENWLSLGDNPLGARTEGAHRVASRCQLFKFCKRADSEKTGFERVAAYNPDRGLLVHPLRLGAFSREVPLPRGQRSFDSIVDRLLMSRCRCLMTGLAAGAGCGDSACAAAATMGGGGTQVSHSPANRQARVDPAGSTGSLQSPHWHRNEVSLPRVIALGNIP